MYPVSTGHLYLINTAIENCETLHLIVCSNNTQTIPGDVRVNAIKEIYKNNPNVIIHSMDDGHLPQHDYECESLEDFYSKWVPEVYNIVNKLDVVFTSESYGDDFAKYLGIKHYLVDIDRKTFPISGTLIRSNPLKYWDFIAEAIRPYFVKRVAIMGPESTGKSILSINLAKHFNTEYVEEYGKTVYEENGYSVSIEDFVKISIGRQKIEDEKIKISNKILICDTEDITTYYLSQEFYPNNWEINKEFFEKRISKSKNYDLYLLLKPDCEEVQDRTRLFLNKRYQHYQIIKDIMIKKGCNFVEIGGDWENRLNESIKNINKYLINKI